LQWFPQKQKKNAQQDSYEISNYVNRHLQGQISSIKITVCQCVEKILFAGFHWQKFGFLVQKFYNFSNHDMHSIIVRDFAIKIYRLRLQICTPVGCFHKVQHFKAYTHQLKECYLRLKKYGTEQTWPYTLGVSKNVYVWHTFTRFGFSTFKKHLDIFLFLLLLIKNVVFCSVDCFSCRLKKKSVESRVYFWTQFRTFWFANPNTVTFHRFSNTFWLDFLNDMCSSRF
jgi:hypothetical protein